MALKSYQVKEAPNEQFKEYAKLGIDIKKINKGRKYYWDKKVLEYFEKYGAVFLQRK